MKRWLPLSLMAIVLLMATAAVVWKYRQQLLEQQPKRGVTGEVAAQSDVLYRWVDADGVTHYGSQPEPEAEKVVFDGRRITPLESVPVTKAADALVAASETAGAHSDNALLRLRAELAEGQEKMRAAKAAMNDL